MLAGIFFPFGAVVGSIVVSIATQWFTPYLAF